MDRRQSHEALKRRFEERETAQQNTEHNKHRPLTDELKETHNREVHLRNSFHALRRVNRIIVSQPTSKQLIQEVCRILTEQMEYSHAWIALLDHSLQQVVQTASFGIPEDKIPVRPSMDKSFFPPCIHETMEHPGALICKTTPAACDICPPLETLVSAGSFSRSLICEDRIYGTLTVSVPEELINDSQEQDLFCGIADEIAYALHTIEQQKQHRQEQIEKLEILESISDALLALDDRLKVTYANHEALQIFGLERKQFCSGMPLLELMPQLAGTELIQAARNAAETKKPLTCETFLDSTLMLVRIFPKKAGLTLVISVTMEKKTFEQSLKQRDELLQRIQRLAKICSWEYRRDTGDFYGSRELYAIFGFEAPVPFEELMQQVHPDDCFFALRRSSRPYHQDFRIFTADTGAVRYIHEKCEGESPDNPGVILGTLQDITEQKRAEDAYSVLIHTTNDLVCEIDTDRGYVVRVNPAFERILGYSQHTLLNHPFTSFIHPDDVEAAEAIIAENLLSGEKIQAFENRCRCSDGSHRWFSWNAVYIPNEREIYAIGRDITERKRTEQKLRSREHLLTNVMDVLPVGVIITDAEGSPVRCNSEAIRIWGDEALGSQKHSGGCQGRFLPDMTEIQPDQWAVSKALREKQPVVDNLIEIDAFDGKKRIIINSAAPVIDSQGTVQAGVIVSVDVTERRKKAEEQERLTAAMHQISEIVIITDHQGYIVYVNPAFETVTGYTAEEVLQKRPNIIKSGKQDESFYRHLWEIITSGTTWTGRVVNRQKNGGLYTEEKSISPVYDANERITNFVSVSRDITEKLRTSFQLQESRRMESVGRLAGGLAHDFNNMLSVIIGYADISLEQLHQEESLYTHVTAIKTAAQRSAQLIQQLLAFAHKQRTEPKVISIDEAVRQLVPMLQRMVGEDITLTYQSADLVWNVYIDPSQIDQIMINLCGNAKDAVEGRGNIEIFAENRTVDDDVCREHTDGIPGDYAVITVTDDGIGMDQDVRERAFEPFFTTKQVGDGTGLGLSTVYGIVRQNKGFIIIDSSPNQGTSFSIFLPRHQ